MKILNYLFPLKCLLCGEPAHGETVPLCINCVQEWTRRLTEPCGICGAEPSLCECYPVKNVSKKYVLMWYNDIPVKRMIRRIKRNADARETEYLAGLLALKIDPVREISSAPLADFACVCNVPRSRINVRRYGFDQAELIAKPLARRLGVPYIDLIDSAGKALEQKTLSGALRTENTKGKYIISETALNKKSEINKKCVLLVDDISTSGATLAECAYVLKKYGFKDVQAALIAQTCRTKKFIRNK